jgi:hypothetical protein
MKRLAREVIPLDFIERIPGKHWRIRYNDDQLRRWRAALAVWQVWHRKPRAARDRDRLGEIDDLLEGLLFRHPDRIRPPGFWNRRFWMERQADALKWRERLLENPTPLTAGACIAWLAVLTFRAAHRDNKPSPKELADLLGISERSIYRPPFGKDTLALALSDMALTPKIDAIVDDESPTTDDFFADCEIDDCLDLHGTVGVHVTYPAAARKTQDPSGRSLKRRVSKSPAWVWEETDSGIYMLVVYPLFRLRRQQRLQELGTGGRVPRASLNELERATASRKSYEDLSKERYCDSTFGGWAAGRCFRDGKHWKWEMNFASQKNGAWIYDSGTARSRESAKCEVLNRLRRQVEKRRRGPK